MKNLLILWRRWKLHLIKQILLEEFEFVSVNNFVPHTAIYTKTECLP
jgi:hypothetical protein